MSDEKRLIGLSKLDKLGPDVSFQLRRIMRAYEAGAIYKHEAIEALKNKCNGMAWEEALYLWDIMIMYT